MCMDTWYKARNMSSFWGWVRVNNKFYLTAFEDFYSVKKLDTAYLRWVIWETLRYYWASCTWGLLNCTNHCCCFIYYMFKGTFPTHMILTFCSASLLECFIVFLLVTHCLNTLKCSLLPDWCDTTVYCLPEWTSSSSWMFDCSKGRCQPSDKGNPVLLITCTLLQ